MGTCIGCKACDIKPAPIKGRAETYEQKRAVMERILAAWASTEGMRLGQLLENAAGGFAIFYVEDESLATRTEAYAKKDASEKSDDQDDND